MCACVGGCEGRQGRVNSQNVVLCTAIDLEVLSYPHFSATCQMFLPRPLAHLSTNQQPDRSLYCTPVTRCFHLYLYASVLVILVVS